jgi:hypothetical protein
MWRDQKARRFISGISKHNDASQVSRPVIPLAYVTAPDFHTRSIPPGGGTPDPNHPDPSPNSMSKSPSRPSSPWPTTQARTAWWCERGRQPIGRQLQVQLSQLAYFSTRKPERLHLRHPHHRPISRDGFGTFSLSKSHIRFHPWEHILLIRPKPFLRVCNFRAHAHANTHAGDRISITWPRSVPYPLHGHVCLKSCPKRTSLSSTTRFSSEMTD